ncbi:hypothetical protein C8R32_11633 [Nitrosospira sp. Nsp5]|uniref:ABC-type transport auxiliary lipoprotein component domain-containing protein n=1 Tax=Nitrosospira multiformis TaxID=1231 RepID=A0ABY0TCN8_9PROT|nr:MULTISPECIES: ABC-type transport auxiliary lipoprotein family protein [Nitrosospira]PTR05787.1 hypothetical protein C8R32_11633 [Nitrosospira sp. Nsp5]SDQ62939.1 hypothetical protein SAMN05216402_1615 [Nitrosospira multiformis]
MKPMTRGILGMVGALLAAGCASVPDTRFYTLSVPSKPSEVTDASQRSPAPIYIEVMPVNVPERLARPQLVVRSRGSGDETQLFILEQDRWSSHFNKELRDAFTTGIAEQTGAVNDVRGVHKPDQPVYRIAIELNEFDAIVGDRVQARFGWAITRSNDGRGAVCYAVISEAASGGIGGVVKGVQRAVSNVVAEVSKNLVELESGRAATCVPQRKIDDVY